MKTIRTEELAALIDHCVPFALLEALPQRYFDEGHLPGALHFPHTEVGARAPAQLPDKALPIVVYCASDTCRNSHTAAALLTNLGYESVSVYVEGKAGWLAAGRALVRAAA
jgi:rhodanese-related sulfurtransferase